jgi:beta-1,2-mannobiose phosphorylase / 1,2-beta-oligomannan phosphorylase
MKRQLYFRCLDLFVKNGEANLIYTFPEKEEGFLRLKKSRDGLVFSDSDKHLKIASFFGGAENPNHFDELAVTQLPDDRYFLTYTKKNHRSRTHLYGAISQNGINWKKAGLVEGVCSFGMVAPEYLFEKHHILYFGSHSIKIAFSSDLAKWHITPDAILRPRKDYFDHSDLKIARILNIDEGIALFYFAKNAQKKLCLGVALLDKDAPGRVIWRSRFPLWEQPANWIAGKTRILGIIQADNEYVAYFEHGRGEIFKDILHQNDPTESKILKKQLEKQSKRDSLPSLTRFAENPIIEPNPENLWEAAATFNPAALCLDDRIHIIYRAQDANGISVFGYASSKNGIRIDERSKNPIYFPLQDFEASRGKKTALPYPGISGGGWGGCEDPRICQIEDKIYMIYIAFNGYQPPGVALTSIKTANFLSKIWDWKKPKLISRPGQIQKNWVIFPEKIKGKYAVLHSLSPKISIDYVESLDSEEVMIDSYHTHHQHLDKLRWDNIVRGIGAPPLKTDYGWLVLYHAMDYRDPNRYKVGAMLLDLHDPEKIIARCCQPILEPEMKYENEGFKTGVVYACGAVIKDGTLFVYYGGADTFVAVASAPLEEFMKQLISSGKVTLASKKIKGN